MFAPLPFWICACSWRAAARDVRFPRIHALLWVDSGRTFCGEAQNAKQATHGKTEVATSGGSAPHACAGPRPASLALPSAAGTLRVLRLAQQLPLPEGVPLRGAAHLVPRAATPEPTPSPVGRLRGLARALSPAYSSDHSPVPGVRLALGYLGEEPYAGKAHVRICEGQSRMAALLDHSPAM